MDKPYRNLSVENIDDYFDAWDYVPSEIISDVWWEKNLDCIKEMTFELWKLDSKGEEVNLKKAGKRLEIIFSNLVRFGLLSK